MRMTGDRSVGYRRLREGSPELMVDDPAAGYHTRVWLEVRPRVKTDAPECVPVPDWLMREVPESVVGDLQRPRRS
jgi:hypothetical protein